MYKFRKPTKTMIEAPKPVEGESIENKVERLMKNKEPIKDGAPLIYTERKDGVIAGYNIRTDRFEVAAEAMDVVQKARVAQRDAKLAGKKKEDLPPADNKINKVEPTLGKADQKGQSE